MLRARPGARGLRLRRTPRRFNLDRSCDTGTSMQWYGLAKRQCRLATRNLSGTGITSLRNSRVLRRHLRYFRPRVPIIGIALYEHADAARYREVPKRRKRLRCPRRGEKRGFRLTAPLGAVESR